MSLFECPHAPPSGQAESKVVMQAGMGLTCRPHSPAHARTHARRTDPLARAVALDPYQWFGVVGNNTTLLVALAAGFGGAFACLLVVAIVMVLRNRRAAPATDPAPGLRTPLYLE